MKEEDDETYTMDEIINLFDEEEQHLMDVIYGGTQAEETCTYNKGYIKRQAVYVCLSCTDVSKSPAGVCYNCSQKCHAEHDILVLYTKRKFRCDCGNSKFTETKCSLEPNKEPLNALNQYDQNYQGLFCTCHRPYPDDEIDDDMLQCIICEDWYHESHLDPKPEGEFDEMTCSACVSRCEFLKTYKTIIQHQMSPEEEPVVGNNEPSSSTDVKRIKLDENACLLESKFMSLQSNNGHNFDPKCVYWPKDWRQNYLCSCDKCKKVYENLDVSFLLDPEDTLSNYAEKGANCFKKVYEEDAKKVNNALNSLPHQAASELAYKLADLQNNIKEFLQSLNGKKEPITAADVTNFFDDKLRKKN